MFPIMQKKKKKHHNRDGSHNNMFTYNIVTKNSNIYQKLCRLEKVFTKKLKGKDDHYLNEIEQIIIIFLIIN